MRRIACISLPRWPTDRLLRKSGGVSPSSPLSRLGGRGVGGEGGGQRAPEPCGALAARPLTPNPSPHKNGERGGLSFATTAHASGGVRLIALNKAAQDMGLMQGMMLAGAKALVPDLVVEASDPVGEVADLLALSRWAMRWTPYTAPAKGLTNTHALFLDITGCAHLFGGESAMLGDMLRRMRALGLTARAACASTPGAAFALARFAPEARDGLSAPDGAALRALVGSMPIEGLRIGEDLAASLRALGLKTIGALAGQSSAALARRFGIDLVRALDRARGREDEAIAPVSEVIPRRLRLRLMEPLMTRDGLEKAIGKAAGEIATLLEAHNEGALQIVVNLYRVDGVVLSLEGGAGRPHRDAMLWNRVLRERVEALAHGEGLDLGFGIDVIEIAAPVVQVLAEIVTDLDPVAAAALASSDALHRLADRLSARLGSNCVRRLGVVAGHVPEKITVLHRFTGEVSRTDGGGVDPKHRAGGKEHPLSLAALASSPAMQGSTSARRPAMLLERAEPIEAMAEVPDGPPRMFRWRALSFKIACAQGPERILCGEEHARDYYRVETTEGRRFWLYRQGLPGIVESPRWYVQGSGA